MKLQKLVYYAQAWSLAWTDRPLFNEKIEAWANGPVVRELYDQHKGKFILSASEFPSGNSSKLSKRDKSSINIVLEAYADKSPQWLSDQTHSEAPWITARKGLADGQRGSEEITLASMSEYYSSL